MKLTIKKRDDLDEGVRALTGNQYRFYLDDQEVTGSLTAVKLEMGLLEANRVDLSFLLDDVEIDADTLAELTAVAEAKEVAAPPDAHWTNEQGTEGWGGSVIPHWIRERFNEALEKYADFSNVGAWSYDPETKMLEMHTQDRKLELTVNVDTLVEEVRSQSVNTSIVEPVEEQPTA